MSLVATTALLADRGIFWADLIRYLLLGEGAALMIISAVSVIDAFLFAYPGRVKMGITLRWLGRFGQVTFMMIVIGIRIGSHLSWRAPLTFVVFTTLLVGTWLTRHEEFLWFQVNRNGGELPDNRVREPL